MDFDSILDHVGHFGKYQFLVMLLACLCQIFGGIHMKAGTFVTPMIKPQLHHHRSSGRTYAILAKAGITMLLFIYCPWDRFSPDEVPFLGCYISSCDNETTQYAESFVKFAVPTVNGSPSPCERYVATDSSCHPNSFINATIACNNFVWDYTDFEETVVSKFNIVCKKSWNGATSQSLFMGGVLLGSGVFGMVSDKFGRKNVILMASSLLVCSSIGTAFAPSFSAFSGLRFITAFAVSGLFQTGYIVAIEFVGTSKRLWCANILQVVFAVGELVLGLIAYFVRKWRKLELIISIPAAFLLLYYWLLPESVRWLISKGKHDKAKQTVLKAARWNGKTIPEHLLRSTEFTNVSYEEESMSGTGWGSSGPLSLFKTPKLRNWSLNIFFNWIVNAMVYYGLSLSAANLSGSTYLNFVLLAAVEIPSVLLATVALSYCGRRWVLCTIMVIGGVACGATIFIPQNLGWLATTLAVIGKSTIAASFAVIYIYSAEIYPTVVRSTGIGLSSMFSRIGAMIAPIINELRKVYRPLPMIIFSIATIVAGFLALRLPETHGKQLPETIEEAERFSIGRMNDILNVPRSRLLSRFSSIPSSHRSIERRLSSEGRRLLASVS